MTTDNRELLSELVGFAISLRGAGISRYEGPVYRATGAHDRVVIELLPENFSIPSPAPTPPRMNPRFDAPPLDPGQLQGQDGLTLQQQIDLYGRPLDSFDPDKQE